MENETNPNLNPTPTPETPTVEEEYLSQIQHLKDTTVSREEYDKLRKEHSALLNSYVNGKEAANAEHAEPTEVRTSEDVRKELFQPTHELTDIEYVKSALELREKVLEETGVDCFVPTGNATAEDYAGAQETAQILQECLDKADGNNAQFMGALQSRLVDIALPRQNTPKAPGMRK